MSVARGTVHSVQFLRFVAATLVVIFHAHLGITNRLHGGAGTQEAYLFGFGAVGVHIFFVISGYIMYLTNVGRPQPFSPKRFFVRRLIRIYPIYWIFLALYLVLEAALAILPAFTPGQLAGAALLWPEDASRIIGPAWTLSFELYFYLAFGLAMMLGARRGLWLLTIGFAISVALGLALRPAGVAAAMMTNALLVEFLAGVWIARVTGARVLPRALGWCALAGAAVGYGLGLAWGYERLPSAAVWGVPSALLVVGAIILDQTGAQGDRRGLVRRLSVLGDSSYSLYLCHILLVTLAVAALQAVGFVPPRFVSVAVVTLVCIGFAHLFYLGVERQLVGRLQEAAEGRVRPSRARAAPAGEARPAAAATAAPDFRVGAGE